MFFLLFSQVRKKNVWNITGTCYAINTWWTFITWLLFMCKMRMMQNDFLFFFSIWFDLLNKSHSNGRGLFQRASCSKCPYSLFTITYKARYQTRYNGGNFFSNRLCMKSLYLINMEFALMVKFIFTRWQHRTRANTFA